MLIEHKILILKPLHYESCNNVLKMWQIDSVRQALQNRLNSCVFFPFQKLWLTMATNKVILEYPSGMDLTLTFFDAANKQVDIVAMAPPLLIRLNQNLEFVSMANGNLSTLLNLSRPESDDDDDVEDNETSEDHEDTDVNMSEDTDPDLDQTIDLVSSDDDDDDDDDDVEEEEEHNSDLVFVSYPTDA